MTRRIGVKLKVRLLGAEDVKKALQDLEVSMSDDPEAIIGFGTDYALAVHERTEVFHKTGGAKFLESALNDIRRGYRRDLARRAKRLLEAGHKFPLAAAIYQKALQVERKAVRRTPVDTGRLRSSHFVSPPRGVAGAGGK